jgi:UDP-hydrolysing UDP-N-acetyl-D-glucosamine 2-epimerase
LKRRFVLVSVGRSDYGIYYPLLRAIEDDPECELSVVVSGAHLSGLYGNTVKEFEADHIPIRDRVQMLLSANSSEAVATSIGVGVINFANSFARLQADIIILLGDRFEMLAAAVAAVPLGIPIAHLHGGEVTEGAMDDSIRHAITKLSHIHFVAAPAYEQRVIQMGEQPGRVFLTGSPIVDAILAEPAISKDEIERELRVQLDGALLITYHPVTLEKEQTKERIAMLLEVLEKFDNELIFTYPNADMDSAVIIDQLNAFAKRVSHAHIFVNLGRFRYHALQRYVAAMVGNSSSGILEASIFRLPVVNVGSRQKGRLRTPNIIDTPEEAKAIETAIKRAISPDFRNSLSHMVNPYGKGDASRQILKVLKTVPLDGSLQKKAFYDLPQAGQPVHIVEKAQPG